MGIFERPKPELLDALETEFELDMPRDDGVDTIDAVRAFADNDARILIGLGGNLTRATRTATPPKPP